MAKRLFDIVVALAALAVAAPLILISAIGIKVGSPGPVFYKACRIGRNGAAFNMFKLRTMHLAQGSASPITAPEDNRIFPLGNLLRKLKIDELPQFWNILSGDMSLVGPRPEAAEIVERHYTDWMRETLRIRPGVTSPGALYNYRMADLLLDVADPEGSYARKMLPPKLALERAYMERANFISDLGFLVLTARAIVAHARGNDISLPQADVAAALCWAPEGPYPNTRV
jgi:lipopolysaccharide/colanic/teichoic acid biosynthesis glycosyltransferase